MNDMTEEEKWKKILENSDRRAKEIKKKKTWTTLSLRIPSEMLSEVDKKVEARIGMNRTAWILEAIQEKLRQENNLSVTWKGLTY